MHCFAKAWNNNMRARFAFQKSKKRLFLGSEEGNLLIYDVESGNLMDNLALESTFINSVAVDELKNKLYYCAGERKFFSSKTSDEPSIKPRSKEDFYCDFSLQERSCLKSISLE